MLGVPKVPFRGIQPFRYVDHAIFLAREEETEELEDLVAIYRGVLLYGASGDGKSSLINAGLLPAVARRRLHPERIRLQPRTGEEIVVERIATTEDNEGEHLPSLLAPEDDDSPRFVMSVQAFEERVRQVCGSSRRPLLIFDQFEEIVTLFEEQRALDVQRDVVEMLVRLLREPLAVKLLFVFREDYLSQVKRLLTAVPEIVDQVLALQALSADALPTIIRGPFERHPGHFERELDRELSERVCAALIERFAGAELSLSEVETVALRLWQSEDPDKLLQSRGVQGLLEDYLGEALQEFSPDLRAAAIALLAQMVTSAGTRNVISAEDLVQRVRADDPKLSTALLGQALERLEQQSRLISRERRREIYLYEITSEFLVPWISKRGEEARLARERHRDNLLRAHQRALERRRRVLLLPVAMVVITVLGVLAYSSGVFGGLEERSVDTRFAVRGDQTPPDDLVVVAIDDVTLEGLNVRFPPRSIHAKVIDRISEDRPKSITYNVGFSGASAPELDQPATQVAEILHLPRARVQQALDEIGDDNDTALATAILNTNGKTALAFVETDNAGKVDALGRGPEALRQIEARAGHALLPKDSDGVIRRFEYEIDGLTSLGVVGAEIGTGRRVDRDEFPDGDAWIDYYGGPGTLRFVSFSDVVQNKLPREFFRGKNVVVGASAASLQDVYPTSTSLDELMSGVEIQATVLDTVRRGLPLRSAPEWLSYLTIVLAGLLAPLLCLRLHALWALLIALLAGVLYTVAVFVVFDRGHIIVMTYTLLALGAGSVAVLLTQLDAISISREGRGARRLPEIS